MGSEAAETVSEIDRVIDQRDVLAMFQPLVHLGTAQVIGYEAVVSGPAGTPLAHPGRLLAAARQSGRLAEFDWLRAAVVYRAASAARLHPSMSVLLDMEPDSMMTTCPPDLLDSVRKAQDRLRLVIELRNDALLDHPGRVFDAITAARQVGWGVAVDGSVADRTSLALIPLVYPDVIKLDLSDWVRGDLAAIARTGSEARMYAEQTGATVLAQGLQEPDDILLARTVGASYGQGWHFGPPLPLPSNRVIPKWAIPLPEEPEEEVDSSPFKIICAKYPAVVTERRFLQPVSDYLEETACSASGTTFLAESFRIRSAMTAERMARLSYLAEGASLTVVAGPEFEMAEGSKIRRTVVASNDALSGEWNVIVVGPHFSAALVARSLGDRGALEYRRFEYSITHDRQLVIQAARSLLRRLG